MAFLLLTSWALVLFMFKFGAFSCSMVAFPLNGVFVFLIYAELMLLGFISLLLTVFQGFISDICMPKHLASFMLPCKKKNDSQEGNNHNKYTYQPLWSKRRLLAEGVHHCEQKVLNKVFILITCIYLRN